MKRNVGCALGIVTLLALLGMMYCVVFHLYGWALLLAMFSVGCLFGIYGVTNEDFS